MASLLSIIGRKINEMTQKKGGDVFPCDLTLKIKHWSLCTKNVG